MRSMLFAVALGLLQVGCGHPQTTPSSQRHEASIRALTEAKTESERFYALADAAKASFELGRLDAADAFAKEVVAMAPRFRRDWNYGNAIHDGNMVLGRIEVRRGSIAEAKRYLSLAGTTPGSPQLDSFGPHMSLARDLLEKGEREAVIDYLEACRAFWELHENRLDAWRADIQANRSPNFGANLLY